MMLFFFAGKTLFKPDDLKSDYMTTALASLGLKNNDRVMLLARKVSCKLMCKSEGFGRFYYNTATIIIKIYSSNN